MSPEAVTSERVYAGLKRAVVRGAYAPGSILIVHMIADEFGTSISPVRDAMHRLIGEGLVEALQGGGFQLPVPTEETLRDLYVWHGQILRLAIKHRSSPRIDIDMASRIAALDPDDSDAIAEVTTDFFNRLAACSRNLRHKDAITKAGDLLYATRLRETGLRDRVGELHAVWSLTVSGRESAIRDAIWAYHRRRLRRVPALVKGLNAEAIR